MKILIVCQHYWPENFLINDIAEELAKRGHTVSVLTGLPNYATGSISKEYKWGKNRYELKNGVRVLRVPIIARHTGFAWRVLNYLSFFVTSSLFAMTHKFDVDVIMVYQLAPVLMGHAGIILKNKLKKPMFFYCLDLWPDQMKIWNIHESNPIYKIMRAYCEYAYGSADIVGISSIMFEKYLVEVNKVSPEKIVYLPQHSARMNIMNTQKERKNNERVALAFAGNIGQQQNIECLLRAIAQIDTDRQFVVHIYGDGSAFTTCVALADELGLKDCVKFHGRVPKETLIKEYSHIDAFLLTLCPESKIGFVANTVPAKFQNYLSAGKPILASIDGETKGIIQKIGCGLAVSADDDKNYAKIIEEFIDNPQNFQDCGKRGRRYFDDNYDKHIVMDKLEAYLKELAQD